jgi:hypothetical protein
MNHAGLAMSIEMVLLKLKDLRDKDQISEKSLHTSY